MPTEVAVSDAPRNIDTMNEKPSRVPEDRAAGERQRHADDRDGRRGAADGQKFVELGVESDQEQQKNDSELREQLDCRVVRIDEPQTRDADDGAADQLTEHGRLPEALRQLAEELGGDEDRDERQQKRGDIQARSVYNLPSCRW